MQHTPTREVEIIKDGTFLTPNEGCDIYRILTGKPADLFREHPWIFIDGDSNTWGAGTVLAEDGTGRAVAWPIPRPW